MAKRVVAEDVRDETLGAEPLVAGAASRPGAAHGRAPRRGRLDRRRARAHVGGKGTSPLGKPSGVARNGVWAMMRWRRMRWRQRRGRAPGRVCASARVRGACANRQRGINTVGKLVARLEGLAGPRGRPEDAKGGHVGGWETGWREKSLSGTMGEALR